MLSLAVLTPKPAISDAIEQVSRETGIFEIAFKGDPTGSTIPAIIRSLQVHDPDVILLDLTDWEAVVSLARQIRDCKLRGIIVGFRNDWNPVEKLAYKASGINHVLREPFSPAELETLSYEALHKERRITNQNILAFLPAKAGGGCSTVVIHAAAGVAASFPKRVLLIETDRRSGVYSIMLNLDQRRGLEDALAMGSALTPVEWHHHLAQVAGLDLLAANPHQRRRIPTWADYYHLLQFVQNRYSYLFVDLPEVVNEATAEVVRSARSIFIVCTPEIASMKMACIRAEELEACEIPRDRVQIIVNRCENGSASVQELEKMLKRPVFSTLPNDYPHLKEAMTESQLAAPESPFTQACEALGRKLAGLPEAAPERSKFALLRKLSRIAS